MANDNFPQLNSLHQTQVSIEKFRIQLGNRVSALERGVDEVNRPIPEVYEEVLELAEEMEHRIDRSIAEELNEIPVWNHWLRHVKGIGPGLAGQLLALLLPPLPERGPSTWYRAAGLIPQERDGIMRLPRPRVGEGKITYHPWLRRCLYNVATSFVRNGGYYRQAYEIKKRELTALHAGDELWPPHRLESASRWSTVRFFLAHLWEKWLEAEGKTGRRAYVVDRLGHSYQAPPEPVLEGKKILKV